MIPKGAARALVLVVALIAVGCGRGDGGEAEEGPIVVGGAFSVTDWMAAYDEPPRQGAIAAINYLNEQGGVLGRQLRLIESDSKSDPAVAGQAAVELLDRGAVVLITPCDFDIGAPVGIEAQRAGVPAVSTCATSPGFPDAVGDMLFMASFGNNTQSAAAAEWAYQDRGWRTTYLVVDQSIDYTRTLGEYFQSRFEELGGSVLGQDTYQFGDEDFSSQIAKIQNLPEEPDFLYISSLVPDIGTILRQLRAAGIDLPVLGGDGYEADLLVEVAGPEAANNTFFTTHGFMGPGVNEQVDLFIDRYQQEFGQPPETSFHGTGWDTVMIIAEGIRRAGTTDGAAVRDAIEAIRDLPVATGRSLSYAPDSHVPTKSVAVIEVVDGEFQLVSWWDPQRIPPA